jgi:adenine specific DNA methylase Mod
MYCNKNSFMLSKTIAKEETFIDDNQEYIHCFLTMVDGTIFHKSVDFSNESMGEQYTPITKEFKMEILSNQKYEPFITKMEIPPLVNPPPLDATRNYN